MTPAERTKRWWAGLRVKDPEGYRERLRAKYHRRYERDPDFRQKTCDRAKRWGKEFRMRDPEEFRRQARERARRARERHRTKDPEGYRLKLRAATLAWRARNPGRVAATARAYRQKVRAKRREQKLSKYGLSIAAFEALWNAQGRVCALCGRPSGEERRLRVGVDHDHVSGTVRGILHLSCNVALGFLDEDPERFRLAADYLERHRG